MSPIQGWPRPELPTSRRRVKGAADVNIADEVERPDFRLLRERLAARHEAMMSPAH